MTVSVRPPGPVRSSGAARVRARRRGEGSPESARLVAQGSQRRSGCAHAPKHSGQIAGRSLQAPQPAARPAPPYAGRAPEQAARDGQVPTESGTDRGLAPARRERSGDAGLRGIGRWPSRPRRLVLLTRVPTLSRSHPRLPAVASGPVRQPAADPQRERRRPCGQKAVSSGRHQVQGSTQGSRRARRRHRRPFLVGGDRCLRAIADAGGSVPLTAESGGRPCPDCPGR